MTRRNAFTGIMAAAGTAIAGTLKAIPQVDIVRQSELQQVIDLENQAEALAVDIHRRLKAGSQLERGALGVSNVSYSDYDEAIGGNCSEGLGGLRIHTAKEIGEDAKLLAEYPDPAEFALY